MSTLTSPATTWQWPADVLAFAKRQQIVDVLEPLRQATLQLFPTAQRLTVSLELDPEIRDEWYLVFDLWVSKAEVPDFVRAVHAWDREFAGLCPPALMGLFCLILHRVTP